MVPKLGGGITGGHLKASCQKKKKKLPAIKYCEEEDDSYLSSIFYF